MTKEESIKAGCTCYDEWETTHSSVKVFGETPLADITEICDAFETDDLTGWCAHCEHGEQCHTNKDAKMKTY